MGKYERKSIEEAEKIVEKILNLEKLSSNDFKNHWFKHAVVVAKRIKKDFKKYTYAKHLGGHYDTIGDIKLSFPKGKEIFIETKMSDTASGTGTKANISQDALTDNLLFSGKVKSWSRFREGMNHEKWIMKYLNQFSKYPTKLESISSLTKQKEEKARFLRTIKKRNKKAKEILNFIQKRDREEKLSYLKYLKGKNQNPEMIKKFLTLIILGVHIQKAISDFIKKKDFFTEIRNLYVYYANSYRGKINVKRESAEKKVKEILGEYKKFKIIFPENSTHCKIVGVKNKKEIPLLQIVLHWKNIAQGIKTPCLNVFDLKSRFN